MSQKNIAEEPNLLIQINYDDGFVKAVNFEPSLKGGLQWIFHSNHYHSKIEECINKWLESYRQRKNSHLQIPLALHLLPKFTQQILYTISKIPFGTIYTYGQIAAMCGQPQAARAVGGACGRNPFLLFVPCHRVLDSKRGLRGFSAGGITVKKSLLVFEEAHFKLNLRPNITVNTT